MKLLAIFLSTLPATVESDGLRTGYELPLPSFTDDVLVEFTLVKKENKSLIEGTK